MDRYKDRKDRIKKLKQAISGDFLDIYEDEVYYIRRGQTKIGIDRNNIIFESGKIESNNEGPGNPGFQFGGDESRIRGGSKMGFDMGMDNMTFDSDTGTYGLNPIARFVPPNVVSYYSLFIRKLPARNVGALRGVISMLTNMLGG